MLSTTMARHSHRLALFTTLATLFIAGCSTSVSDGDDGSGGGGGSSSGEEECTSYEGECQPGDTYECGSPPAVATGECEIGPDCTTQWGTCWTPLVLSFDGGPVELFADGSATFDLSGMESTVTDWPTAHTPWLAIDLDGDGRIGDGRELFGSMSLMPDGRRAENGFEALRALDDNGDGRVDASDPSFAKLLVWRDGNRDRTSAPHELTPASASVVSIELAYRREPRCDARGNCEIERAAFRFRDAAGVGRTGEVIDVYLRAQR